MRNFRYFLIDVVIPFSVVSAAVAGWVAFCAAIIRLGVHS